MKKSLNAILLFFLIFISLQINAQSLQIANIQGCVGDTVVVPINISAIDSAGAITLFISYDTTALKFLSFININPLASGTIFNDVKNTNGQLLGKIAISWVTISSGVNFNQAIFGNLKFKILNTNCSLMFLSGCETANYQSQIINANYINGGITVPDLPVISTQPILDIVSSQLAKIRISSQFAFTQNWQKKSGNNWFNIQNDANFQGVSSDTLIITNLSSIANGTLFRCKLNNTCLDIYTDSIPVITTYLSEKKFDDFILYPNPITDFVNIKSIKSEKIAEIKLFQIDGKKLGSFEFNVSNDMYTLDVRHLLKGLYFIEILSADFQTKLYKIIKK